MNGELTRINEHDVYYFTEGACFLLAQEIEKAHGWPLAAFWVGFASSGHMFNVLPDGRYLDIRGAHTRDELFAQNPDYRAITTRHVEADQWFLPFHFEDAPAVYTGRAREIIPTLLASIELADTH
jgi:hypothetical protein